MTFQTTITGQLSLLMLIEQFYLNDFEVISGNTDGIVVKYDKSRDREFKRLYRRWEELTKMILEETTYEKIIFRDINNYLAILTNGYIKEKGCFITKPDYHQNPSQLIVPIALKEYYVNGTPIEKTITSHKDIYDFCIRQKAKKGTEYMYYNTKETIAGFKTNRFYVSKPGYAMVKYYTEKETEERVVKGYTVTPFNEYFHTANYNIDYSYYIGEVNKIISLIDNRQLELF